MVLSGNTSVSNFSTWCSFRIRKSIGSGYSSQSSPVFGLSFLLTSPSLHPLGLRPVARLQLHLPPPSHLLSWHLTAPLPRSIFGYYTQTRLGYPVLLAIANAALAHHPATPQQRRLHTLSYTTSGHRFVPRHRSGVQVHTLTS